MSVVRFAPNALMAATLSEWRTFAVCQLSYVDWRANKGALLKLDVYWAKLHFQPSPANYSNVPCHEPNVGVG